MAPPSRVFINLDRCVRSCHPVGARARHPMALKIRVVPLTPHGKNRKLPGIHWWCFFALTLPFLTRAQRVLVSIFLPIGRVRSGQLPALCSLSRVRARTVPSLFPDNRKLIRHAGGCPPSTLCGNGTLYHTYLLESRFFSDPMAMCASLACVPLVDPSGSEVSLCVVLPI